MDNAHSGNFVNFACPAGNYYHDLATIFFNTQAREGTGSARHSCGCAAAAAHVSAVGRVSAPTNGPAAVEHR